MEPSRDNQTPEGTTQVIDDELLVSYLDGELDQDQITIVESSLASDPLLRQRLEGLRLAWDLLEELPTPKPNPNFAQSTIEMVAVSVATPSQVVTQKWRWIRRIAAACLVCAAMFWAGYFWTRSQQWTSERVALQTLPLLANWESLKKIVEAQLVANSASSTNANGKAISSFEWLEMLCDVDGLSDVVSHSDSQMLGREAIPKSISERRAWINALDSTERDRLSANLESFKGETRPEVQRAALELASKIEASPKRDELLSAANNYALFLSGLSTRERDTLQDLPANERQIDLQRRVNRKLVEVYCQALPEEDREAVRDWLQEMAEQYMGLLPFDGPRGVVEDLRYWLSGRTVIGEADLERLLESLSEPAQEVLGRLDVDERDRWIVWYFVGGVERMPGSWQMRRDVNRAALQQAFDARPEKEKDSLEFRAPSIVQESLGRGRGGRNSGGGRRPPGDFGPGNGGPVGGGPGPGSGGPGSGGPSSGGSGGPGGFGAGFGAPGGNGPGQSSFSPPERGQPTPKPD